MRTLEVCASLAMTSAPQSSSGSSSSRQSIQMAGRSNRIDLMAYRDVTAAQARAAFSYEPETGIVRRRANGYAITGDNGAGYSRVYVAANRVYLHRLVWLLHHGVWPAGQIDHIDGDRRNNAISNLRDVSHAVNAQNEHRARRSNRSTGVLGVHFDASRKRYAATITVGRKSLALGRFNTVEEAQSAYLQAKRVHHAGCTI